MSSRRTGDNRQEEDARRPEAGTTRQANAEEMLAELQRVLESSGPSPFARHPSSAPAIRSASPSVDGEPRESTDFDSARDRTRPATRLRRRRWGLAASGLALGVAALAGAGLALKLTVPGPASPLSDAPTQAQSHVQPRATEPGAASSAVGGPLVRDSLSPDPVQAGRRGTGLDAAESTPKASAASDAQRPAEGADAAAAATKTDAPALPNPAAARAPAALQAAGREPSQSVLVSPDRTPMPIARPSVDSRASTSPRETPKPHTEATTTAGAKADSARPPAAQTKASATPNASKKPVKETVAKSGKAITGAAAEAPKNPLVPLPPEKPVESLPAQPVAEPAAAAPIALPSFAAQSVGQLTHAFGYLTRLPIDIIQHVRDPNMEGK